MEIQVCLTQTLFCLGFCRKKYQDVINLLFVYLFYINLWVYLKEFSPIPNCCCIFLLILHFFSLHLDTETNVTYRIKQVRSCQNQHIQDMRQSELGFPLTFALVSPGEGLPVLPEVRLVCRAKGEFHGRRASSSSPACKCSSSPLPVQNSYLAFILVL